MKKTLIAAAGAIMLMTANSTVWALPPGMPATPDVNFQPPKGTRLTLDNGTPVYILRDNTLPVVHIGAIIGAGNANDAADKTGLAELVSQQIKDGGTKNFTAEEIDKQLEYLGASIDAASLSEETQVTMTALKKDLPKVLDIYADVLLRPVFDEKKLELAKGEELEMLRRRNDKPTDILFREGKRLYYGAAHPYGQRKEAATISGLSRADLAAFHSAYYRPNNTILAVSGDFASDKEIMDALNARFASWEKGEVKAPAIPAAAPLKGRKIYLLEKELSQAFIIIVQKGLSHNSPSEYPLTLLSEVLGGGMQSRLMTEVRTKRGLAYTVQSASPRRRHGGFTYTYCGTKPETYSQALTEILHQLDLAAAAPMPQDDLKRGKDAIINPFVFKFPTPFKLMTERAVEEFYGLKDGYLDNYVARIRAVTGEDIMRTAKEFYNTSDAVILVVGNSKKFDKPLSEFGPVTVLAED